MHRTRTGLLVCSAIAILVLLAACGAGGSSKEDQAKAEEWTWLNDTQQELDGKREELADLKAAAEAAAMSDEAEEAEAELEEGEEAAEEIDYEAQISQLGGEVESLTEEYSDRLVGFLNSDPMIEGEEPTERQLAALRLKSAEDIILAQEWIDKGGDYKRAIDILNTALMFDPDNPDLQAALEKSEFDRYMSLERFALAEKGMNEASIRRVLGQANLHNIREYPDKDVVAWFYPTAQDGSAGAVWFQPDKKSGELVVYQIKFEAIDPTAMQNE